VHLATSVFFAQAALLAAANGRNYDSIEQSAWTTYQLTCPAGSPQVWRELYYDDAQSLGVKYDMINYWNLRGMGIWALGYDAGHPEMANLIAAKFLNDKTPPKVGIVNLPASETSEGFPVSWTGQDDWNGIASYDVQVSTDGGPFTAWLTGITETGDDFQGVSGHNYSFRVRATDGVGNVGPWDVTSTYTASPRSPSTASSPSRPRPRTRWKRLVHVHRAGQRAQGHCPAGHRRTGQSRRRKHVVPGHRSICRRQRCGAALPGPWVEVSNATRTTSCPSLAQLHSRRGRDHRLLRRRGGHDAFGHRHRRGKVFSPTLTESTTLCRCPGSTRRPSTTPR